MGEAVDGSQQDARQWFYGFRYRLRDRPDSWCAWKAMGPWKTQEDADAHVAMERANWDSQTQPPFQASNKTEAQAILDRMVGEHG